MSTPESEPRAKILVVDDNEANRALARSALEDEGYDVLVARDGAEGVAVFESARPDCVLLDVRMPQVDGFTACERIRALPGGRETPVLFLTALRDVDTFDRALAAGGDDFLTKPVRPTELVVRVQTALELRRARRDLREHYDAMKRQRDDLMRVQLQKERLTAFVVHDLKNPVNSMDLHAQLLMRMKDLPDSARDCARQIRAEARQLTRMITNLLDLSKSDEGKLVPRLASVDLVALANDVALELKEAAAVRGVSIEVHLDTNVVVADEDLLRRTLANLLENAVKYAPEKTTVSLDARAVDGDVVIGVRDHGKGIPDDLKPKIFDPFVQVDTGHRVVARSSRGLGLSFCKMAVEAHGGRIRVEDATPGARFVVVLPSAKAT